jgi:hypothetical protein
MQKIPISIKLKEIPKDNVLPEQKSESNNKIIKDPIDLSTPASGGTKVYGLVNRLLKVPKAFSLLKNSEQQSVVKTIDLNAAGVPTSQPIDSLTITTAKENVVDTGTVTPQKPPIGIQTTFTPMLKKSKSKQSQTFTQIIRDYVDTVQPSLDKSKWLPNESWRTSHISNEYFISDEGRCYSQKSKIILAATPAHNKYISYKLGGDPKNKKGKSYTAHELVMEAWVGPRPAGLKIDHIDRDRGNNKLVNLRYVTNTINALNRGKVHQRGKPCNEYDLQDNLIKRWERAKDAADFYKLDLRILTIKIRGGKPYNGSNWEYVEDEILGERWKQVSVATGKLEVSDHGRVRNGFFLANYGSGAPDDYRAVMVGDKKYLIHALVCEHFNGPSPGPGAIANHLDEDKANNHYTNLKWVSGIRENTEYSMARAIIKYDKLGNVLTKYASIAKVVEDTGISSTTIGRSCKGQKTVNTDYIFRYEGDTFTIVTPLKSIKGKKVINRSALGVEIARYNSIAEASISSGLAESTLSALCNGKMLTRKGAPTWSFLDS